jgi:hypothetical protein
LSLGADIFARIGRGGSKEKRAVLDLFAEDLRGGGGFMGTGEERLSWMLFF